MISPQSMDVHGSSTQEGPECLFVAQTDPLLLLLRSPTHAMPSPLTSVWVKMHLSSLTFLPPAQSQTPATVSTINKAIIGTVLKENKWSKEIDLFGVSAAVELEYSLDLGLTWQPVVRDCLPTSPDCSSYTLQRLLVSDIYNKWGRVTLPIPSYARSAQAGSFIQKQEQMYHHKSTTFSCV